MPSYIVKGELDELNNKYKLIKTLKNKSRSEVNSYEYEKILASYFLVETCSGFEQACKVLVTTMLMTNSATLGVKKYVEQSRFLPSANYNDLCDFLAKFDGHAKSLFKSRVHDHERDSLKSLYIYRQRVVHYSESKRLTLTFNDVEAWHKDATWVIRKFETVLKHYF